MAQPYNRPLSAVEMPRAGGISTMMRLPFAASPEGLGACFIGIPLDTGTSNRSGTRLGPRQIRAESVMIRPYNSATRAAPFDSIQIADLGDVAVNNYNLPATVDIIEAFYRPVVDEGVVPISLGGDHTISYPILKALSREHGPLAMIHVDAHADVADRMFGEPIAHGTPFRRAVDSGCLQTDAVFQIGLRGSANSLEDYDWAREQGFTAIRAEQCWGQSLVGLMEGIRQRIGDRKVYLSFDIDGIDPAFAPGTGTPEIGGLTVPQALEIIRGCRGLNLVGADIVEVSPPYDPFGTTAYTAANFAFEMLCVLPKVAYL
ncbi:MAG: agmatinase [Mesorhizobium sp.]